MSSKPALNKNEPLCPNNLEELVTLLSIPVSVAVFHRTVQSFGSNGIVGEPETAFYAPESKSKPSRTAKMYYTPHGLICEQKYGTVIVPLANVVFARVK